MMIMKAAMPRRTVLRGLGATLALPLLDSMVPALTALARSAAKPALRFGVVYIPNGVIPANWFPAAEGVDYELTPTLQPLEPFRKRMLVLSGLDSTPPVPPDAPTQVHGRASTKFLTNVHPTRAVRAGESLDQIAARVIGKDTQLRSLELALESVDSGATCDSGSCVYTATISWAGPTAPLPMEHNPRAAFERMFGDGVPLDPEARRARTRAKTSILDALLDDVSRLQKTLGPADRGTLTAYLDAVRDVEQRIQRAASASDDVRDFAQPAGIPATFEEHAKLMFDLQVLAYQADITRVTTFMLGREFSGRTYREIGVPDAHHPISHHQNDPDRVEKCARINHYHVTLFKYFLDKLAATPSGDGSLLDQVAIVYGAGMCDGNGHSPENLPLLLVGGGAGKLQGGRHNRYAKGTPLANLHVTLLDKFGVPMERFGNSTGPLPLGELSNV